MKIETVKFLTPDSMATQMAFRHTEPDLDAEFRKDHIESARFAVHVSLANFLKLLKVPSEGREQCWAEVSAILRTYEPS